MGMAPFGLFLGFIIAYFRLDFQFLFVVLCGFSALTGDTEFVILSEAKNLAFLLSQNFPIFFLFSLCRPQAGRAVTFLCSKK